MKTCLMKAVYKYRLEATEVLKYLFCIGRYRARFFDVVVLFHYWLSLSKSMETFVHHGLSKF